MWFSSYPTSNFPITQCAFLAWFRLPKELDDVLLLFLSCGLHSRPSCVSSLRGLTGAKAGNQVSGPPVSRATAGSSVRKPLFPEAIV